MKRIDLKSAALGLALLAVADAAGAGPAETKPSPGTGLTSPEDQASYTIGVNLGANLRGDGVNVDPARVLDGLKDGLSGATPRLTADQMRAVIQDVQTQVQVRRQERAEKAAETNKAEGAAFLKANAAKPGVVSLPSGLQYEIIRAGTGPIPKADDTVSCNYRGTLLSGKEFDSSYARNEPLSIAVNGVIKGWTEALERMSVGSKWRLFVPSELAYGVSGAGAEIGPNSTLIFEVELLSIQPKA